MPQFCVVNQETGFVAYEAATIGQVRGFLDGRNQEGIFRERILVDVEIRGEAFIGYRPVLIDDRTGQILASGPEIGIDELEECLFNVRVAILPAVVVKALAGWERPPGEIPDDDDDFLGGDDDDDAAEAWKGGSR